MEVCEPFSPNDLLVLVKYPLLWPMALVLLSSLMNPELMDECRSPTRTVYLSSVAWFSPLCCTYLTSYITLHARDPLEPERTSRREPRVFWLQLQLKPGVESEEKPPVPVSQGSQMQKAASRNSGLTENSLLLPNAQPLLAEAGGPREWMRTPTSTILGRIVTPLQVSRGASHRAHIPHHDEHAESLECSERYQALGLSPRTVWGNMNCSPEVELIDGSGLKCLTGWR